MALCEDGCVLAWGGTLHKKLGNKNEEEIYYEDEEITHYPSPHVVPSLFRRKIVDISCGDFHSVALELSGTVYTWGGGGVSYNKGQCGHGTNKDNENPKAVDALSSYRIVKITAGGYHTMAVSDDNEIFCWGTGIHGECGYGDFNHVNTPQRARLPQQGMIENEPVL